MIVLRKPQKTLQRSTSAIIKARNDIPLLWEIALRLIEARLRHFVRINKAIDPEKEVSIKQKHSSNALQSEPKRPRS